MQSGRAALASSGRISGSGLASARMTGLIGHGLDHLGRQHAGGRAAQEHVGALHHIGQRAQAGVGLGKACLAVVKTAGAAGVDQAFGIAGVDVPWVHAQRHHHVQAGNRRRTGAAHRHFHVANLLAHQFQPVEQGGRGDDGRAVLVVMEHRDVHALAQLGLDVEALGRFDVFQVDAAQRRLQRGDDVDQLVGVALVQLDVEHVDAGELLEQAALALHHRLAGQRADVAQAQHGRAVGDHADQIAARGVFGRLARVGLDVEAGIGHAGRIGQRQIKLIDQRLGRCDRNLAARGQAVVVAGGIAQGRLGGREGLEHGGLLMVLLSRQRRLVTAARDASLTQFNPVVPRDNAHRRQRFRA